MKAHFLTAVIAAVSLSNTFAQETIRETEKWHLNSSAFAQMKLVPTNGTETIMTKLYGASWERPEWNGPWKPFSIFQIRIGYSKGIQTRPRQVEFVRPSVELQGFANDSAESHCTTVTLFEGPSNPKDIKVRVFPLEGTPPLNAPLKVATLFSEHEKLSWDVYVRFTELEPDYVKVKK